MHDFSISSSDDDDSDSLVNDVSKSFRCRASMLLRD
jgi:hypothetical protein